MTKLSRILIVDDEKSMRVTLTAFLQQAGYITKTAEDAEVALQILKEDAWDILLTDIIMPRRSGLELVEAARMIHADLQAILMTGDPSVETAVQAIHEGVFDYLSKPVRKHELIQAVQRAARVKDALDAKQALEQENRRYREDLEKMVRDRTADLIRSEQRFRDYMTSAPDGMFIWNESGTIEEVNPAGANLLQVATQNIIGRSIVDFHVSSERSRIRKIIQSLLDQKQAYWEGVYQKAYGNHAYWSVSVGELSTGGFIGFAKDITQRRKIEEDLRISEERFRVALKSIPLIIAHTDRDLRYTWVHNPEQGFTPDRYIGHTDEEVASEKGASELQKMKALAVNTGAGQHKEIRFGATPDLRIYEYTVEPLRDADNRIIGATAVGVNITERKLQEEEMKRMTIHDSLTGLYNRAYFEEELSRADHDESYPLYLISADLDGLKLINQSWGSEHGDFILTELAGIIHKTVGLAGMVARLGSDEFAVLLRRMEEEQGNDVVNKIREGIRKYNSTHQEIPMNVSLGYAFCKTKDMRPEELLKQADERMLQNKMTGRNSARSRIIRALMSALGERDHITQGHGQRMESMCLNMARELQLPEWQKARLSLLAQVHDLGKVGIPDSILMKQGPLDEAEWEIMKTHPEKGYRIAKTDQALEPVAELILRHHERWDGKGYPLGLAAQQIPLECRIMAIADAFDAMTNDRPYRKPLSWAEASAEIVACAGTQFDPDLVPVFMQLIGSGKDDVE